MLQEKTIKGIFLICYPISITKASLIIRPLEKALLWFFLNAWLNVNDQYVI